MRLAPSTLACAAALVVVGVAVLAGCGYREPPFNSSVERMSVNPVETPAGRRALAGAPPALGALHRQANRLLDGGAPAFKKRLEQLEGHPVVVNKWASWCPPCRAESPFFRKQSMARGRSVAFLGVNSNDSGGAARKFLETSPATYPHYSDPRMEVAEVFHAVAAFPTTAFYDANGKLAYVKQGGYSSELKLGQDIDRYAK